MSWITNVRRRVLPNGLTLLVERVTSAPVVAVVTHLKAGYFDEPDEWVGIAHVLEHMYFKGTARRGPGDIARETQLVGGYINAATIYDKTVYYTVLPSADGGLERAVDIQADALMHSALDPDELSRELEVIIQEAKRKLDSPSAVASESLYALLFRVHRMRRWRIGTEEGLRRLTPDHVRSYYESRYAPNRAIVAIVGDIDPEAALALATQQYGGWIRPVVEVPGSPAEPDERRAALRVMHGDVERPLAEIGWRTVGTLHPDAPALDVAAMVLGSGRGSRLYRALREPGVAAAAHAVHYTPTDVGVLEIGVEADQGRLDEAITEAVSLAAALGRRGVIAGELERVRALFATHWARRLESMDGRASALCEAEAVGGHQWLDELYARTLAVTEPDVRRVAARYLSPDVAGAVLYLRDGEVTALADAWPPSGRVAEPGSATVPDFRPETQRVGGPGAQLDLPGGIVHHAFEGADVLVRAKPGSGLVTLLVHAPGLPGDESEDTAGISWLLARSAMRGAGALSGSELAIAAERLGGGVGAAVGADTLGWSITVPPASLEQAAAVLRWVAFEPTLDDEAVERERRLLASDARRARDDMLRYPLQAAIRQALPHDAYGLPPLGDPERVGTIEAARVRAWAGALASRRPVVVVVGDAPSERLATAGASIVAATPARSASRPAPAPQWTAARGDETRRKEQTALAMAFPASPFRSPDRHPLRVVGALLSGLAGRLFDALRERRALAYTVAAMPWLALRAGVMFTYIATSPEREDEARDAMLEELARLQCEPPATDELERARNYAAGTLQLRQQSGAAIAGEILEGWVQGAVEEVAEAPERLRAVTVDDVVRVAAQVFRPERRAEYVVRGRES